ncbi:MAG: hypothetical protein ACYTEG_16615 [Planctomycetota bacterium]|jgi:ribosomal protein L29
MKWIGAIAGVALAVACSKQPPETKTIVQVIESPDGEIAELRGELEKERQANVAARAKLAEDLRQIVREEVKTALAELKREAVEFETKHAAGQKAEAAALADLQDARVKLVLAQRTYTQESDQVRMLKERCARLQERYDALRVDGAK